MRGIDDCVDLDECADKANNGCDQYATCQEFLNFISMDLLFPCFFKIVIKNSNEALTSLVIIVAYATKDSMEMVFSVRISVVGKSLAV